MDNRDRNREIEREAQKKKRKKELVPNGTHKDFRAFSAVGDHPRVKLLARDMSSISLRKAHARIFCIGKDGSLKGASLPQMAFSIATATRTPPPTSSLTTPTFFFLT